jgi:hypothetical protein
MDAMARACALWRSRNVRLNAPASPEALEALARLFEDGVPADLGALLSLANGMKDYETDRWNLSLWSSERIAREHGLSRDRDGEWLAIGDMLISSRFLRIRRLRGRPEVRLDGVPETFPTLSAFFERYLASPESLRAQSGAG